MQFSVPAGPADSHLTPPAERSGDTGAAEQTRPQGQDGQEMQLPRCKEQRENRSEVLLHARLPKILPYMLTLLQTTTPGWAKQRLSSDIWVPSTAEIPECTLQSYLCVPGLTLSTWRKKICSHLLPHQGAPMLGAAVTSPSPRARNAEISTHQLSVFLAQCR